MASSEDLTDDQIERLLAEAEVRLSTRKSPSEKAVTKQGEQPVVIHAGSRPEAGATQGHAEQATRGQNLTVRIAQLPEKKKSKAAQDDAGEGWFHMPKTNLTPQLKRDLQLLRMRGVLDPKQHWRKDTRKDFVPTYSQVGTIVEGPTEYFSARLTRKERKRTIVEEILGSTDTKSKFKTRYNDIQARKTSGKKGFYKHLVAQRRKRRP